MPASDTDPFNSSSPLGLAKEPKAKTKETQHLAGWSVVGPTSLSGSQFRVNKGGERSQEGRGDQLSITSRNLPSNYLNKTSVAAGSLHSPGGAVLVASVSDMETLTSPNSNADREACLARIAINEVPPEGNENSCNLDQSRANNFKNNSITSSYAPFYGTESLSPYSMLGASFAPGKPSQGPPCKAIGRSVSPLPADTSTKLKTLTPFSLRNRREPVQGEDGRSSSSEMLSTSADELHLLSSTQQFLSSLVGRRSPLGLIQEGSTIGGQSSGKIGTVSEMTGDRRIMTKVGSDSNLKLQEPFVQSAISPGTGEEVKRDLIARSSSSKTIAADSTPELNMKLTAMAGLDAGITTTHSDPGKGQMPATTSTTQMTSTQVAPSVQVTTTTGDSEEIQRVPSQGSHDSRRPKDRTIDEGRPRPRSTIFSDIRERVFGTQQQQAPSIQEQFNAMSRPQPKKEKSTDCDSALIPLLCVHG